MIESYVVAAVCVVGGAVLTFWLFVVDALHARP